MTKTKPHKRIITNSEISCWKGCPQEHEYRYEIGWRPKGADNLAALSGSGIHKGIEWLYLGETFESCVGAIRALFNGHVTPRMQEIDDPQKYWDARDQTVEIFKNYITHWWGQDSMTAVHPVTGKPLIEYEFEIPVYTPAGRASKLFSLRGKVDRVIFDDGEYWIQDHKSKADLSNKNMLDFLVYDQQMRMYCWATQIYLGIPIAGADYNLIRRKSHGKPSINKNGEVSVQSVDMPVDVYTQALVDQDWYLTSLSEEERKEKKLVSGLNWEKYDKEIERLKNVKWFDRVRQRYSSDDYRDIQLEIYHVTRQMHSCTFPHKAQSSCDHWSGCRFKPICQGLDPEGMFTRSSNRHPELDQNDFHPPLGKPYKIEDKPKRIGFENLLDAVNP